MTYGRAALLQGLRIRRKPGREVEWKRRRPARCSGSALALLKSAGQDGPLLCPGPLCGGESGTTGRVAGIGRDADAFSSAHGCAVEKPGPGSRTCRAGCPASAKRGGLSLWLSFSLATQRESNSAAEGRRKLLTLMQQEHRAQGALLQVRVMRGNSVAASDRPLRPYRGKPPFPRPHYRMIPVCPNEYRPGCGHTVRPCGSMPTLILRTLPVLVSIA